MTTVAPVGTTCPAGYIYIPPVTTRPRERSGGGGSIIQTAGSTLPTGPICYEIASLTVAQLSSYLNRLRPEQIAFLTRDHVLSLSGRTLTDNLNKLTPEQFGFLSKEQILSLLGYGVQILTSAQVQGLLPSQMEYFTPSQIAYFTTEQFQIFLPAQLAALSDSQIRGLSPEQAKALQPEQTASMTASQISILKDIAQKKVPEAIYSPELSKSTCASRYQVSTIIKDGQNTDICIPYLTAAEAQASAAQAVIDQASAAQASAAQVAADQASAAQAVIDQASAAQASAAQVAADQASAAQAVIDQESAAQASAAQASAAQASAAAMPYVVIENGGRYLSYIQEVVDNNMTTQDIQAKTRIQDGTQGNWGQVLAELANNNLPLDAVGAKRWLCSRGYLDECDDYTPYMIAVANYDKCAIATYFIDPASQFFQIGQELLRIKVTTDSDGARKWLCQNGTSYYCSASGAAAPKCTLSLRENGTVESVGELSKVAVGGGTAIDSSFSNEDIHKLYASNYPSLPVMRAIAENDSSYDSDPVTPSSLAYTLLRSYGLPENAEGAKLFLCVTRGECSLMPVSDSVAKDITDIAKDGIKKHHSIRDILRSVNEGLASAAKASAAQAVVLQASAAEAAAAQAEAYQASAARASAAQASAAQAAAAELEAYQASAARASSAQASAAQAAAQASAAEAEAYQASAAQVSAARASAAEAAAAQASAAQASAAQAAAAYQASAARVQASAAEAFAAEEARVQESAARVQASAAQAAAYQASAAQVLIDKELAIQAAAAKILADQAAENQAAASAGPYTVKEDGGALAPYMQQVATSSMSETDVEEKTRLKDGNERNWYSLLIELSGNNLTHDFVGAKRWLCTRGYLENCPDFTPYMIALANCDQSAIKSYHIDPASQFLQVGQELARNNLARNSSGARKWLCKNGNSYYCNASGAAAPICTGSRDPSMTSYDVAEIYMGNYPCLPVMRAIANNDSSYDNNPVTPTSLAHTILRTFQIPETARGAQLFLCVTRAECSLLAGSDSVAQEMNDVVRNGLNNKLSTRNILLLLRDNRLAAAQASAAQAIVGRAAIAAQAPAAQVVSGQAVAAQVAAEQAVANLEAEEEAAAEEAAAEEAAEEAAAYQAPFEDAVANNEEAATATANNEAPSYQASFDEGAGNNEAPSYQASFDEGAGNNEAPSYQATFDEAVDNNEAAAAYQAPYEEAVDNNDTAAAYQAPNEAVANEAVANEAAANQTAANEENQSGGRRRALSRKGPPNRKNRVPFGKKSKRAPRRKWATRRKASAPVKKSKKTFRYHRA
jgi:hypothetical protein